MNGDASADLAPEFFAQMVESVGVGVGIYGRDGRYIYVNDSYAGLFAVEPESLIGTPLWEIVPDIEADQFDDYWASFEGGDTREYETVHEYNGERVPVATVTTQRIIEGTPYHFGTIKDISERKAREREIERQNERLENFASIVSHDLRNPLNVAQGYLDILRDDVDNDELRLVDNALERMGVLITELLTLAQRNDNIGETEPVSLTDAAKVAWNSASTADATLHIEADDAELMADRSRLQQLFENLFRNSVEHGSTNNRAEPGDSVEHGSTDSRTQSGGSVEHGLTDCRPEADDSVEGSDVTVTVGREGTKFYVADDGIGIPSADRERVFETGYTTNENGTGFGLSIVQQIVTGHEWEVQVTESADGGARFEITGVEFIESD